MNRVKSGGMIPDPVPFVPLPPLTDEYRTLGNNPVLDSHNKFVGELVKDAIHVGRFVPVVGSVIVIVEGTVAAGKHGAYMIGLVADGNFAGAANAHTAYMLSSAVSISGNDWLADVSGFDKLLDILDEKGNQNGRLAGAASKEILMVMLPAALARPAMAGNAPAGVLRAEAGTVRSGVDHLDQLVAQAGRESPQFVAWRNYLEKKGFTVTPNPRLSEIAHVDSVNMVVQYDPNRFTRLVMRHEQFHVQQHFNILNNAPSLFEDFTRAGSRLIRMAEADALRRELDLAMRYARKAGVSLDGAYFFAIDTRLANEIGFNLNRVLYRVQAYPGSSDATLWNALTTKKK